MKIPKISLRIIIIVLLFILLGGVLSAAIMGFFSTEQGDEGYGINPWRFFKNEASVFGSIIIELITTTIGFFLALRTDDVLERRKEHKDKLKYFIGIQDEIQRINSLVNEDKSILEIHSSSLYFDSLIRGGKIDYLFEHPLYTYIVDVYGYINTLYAALSNKSYNLSDAIEKEPIYSESCKYWKTQIASINGARLDLLEKMSNHRGLKLFCQYATDNIEDEDIKGYFNDVMTHYAKGKQKKREIRENKKGLKTGIYTLYLAGVTIKINEKEERISFEKTNQQNNV